MNILPKKRWHVRTKENIARVRRDEAAAAEQERQEKLRVENADREARLNLLKSKSKSKLHELGVIDTEHVETNVSSQHIDLFAEYEQAFKNTNKEHDNEVKEKREEYEKKIGYLTYLGQDSNEALRKKNWYEVLPEERFSKSNEIKDTYDKLVLRDEDGKVKTKELDVKDGEVAWKSKQKLDPFNLFKKYCNNVPHNKLETKQSNIKPTDYHNKRKNKKKKHKKDNDKTEKLQKLREARLKREKEERCKTEIFLRKLNEPSSSKEPDKSPIITAQYNSQFNPELARQNYR